MNYFAHGRQYLDHPFLLAGTALPDWLSVVDRRVRVRSPAALRFLTSRDQRVVGLAAGILRHHEDDAWFHRTRAFAELSWQFTASLRDELPGDAGLRPSFLGHILVELLLDAALIQSQPQQLRRYYETLDRLDAELIAWIVNRMAGRPAAQLAAFITRFSAERFLYDYAEDAKLLYRLNTVMRRVGLSALPNRLCDWFPAARQQVQQRQTELLDRTPPAQRAARPVPPSRNRQATQE
jgi:hypothetical protein